MKKLYSILLLLCVCCATMATAVYGEENGLAVWAIESPQITDYQTNGQSLWMRQLSGIPVTWISTPRSGWYQAFQASVMSGEKVDIYLYDFDTSEATLLGIDMGYIIPLEDYITQENTPNIYAILENDPELKKLITAPDGHIYTLFTNNAYNLSAYKQKLWVNHYFLEKYTKQTNFGMPETTSDFERMLVYFVENDMNEDGMLNEVAYIGQNGVDGMYNLFGAFLPSNSGNGFGFYYNDEGELTFAYTQQAYKDALAYVRSLYAAGLISPDTFTTSYEERYSLTSGSKKSVRVGVVTGVTASQVVQLSNEPDAMTYGDYLAIPPLEGPNGVRTVVTEGENAVSLRNAITIHCNDPLLAMKWLDLGYSDAARMYALYGGIENADWFYVEGENLLGAGKVIVGPSQIEVNKSWGGQGIVYRVTEDDYLSMDAGEINFSDALCTYRANLAYRPYALQSPWPSIVWPGEYVDEAAQYSEIYGLIKPAVTTYYTDVILGRKDLQSDWDDYVAQLNDMGLERFIELTCIYIEAGGE